MNGIGSWLYAQVHIAGSVIGAVATNQPAPARQVVIYTLALAALAFVIPKLFKLISK